MPENHSVLSSLQYKENGVKRLYFSHSLNGQPRFENKKAAPTIR